MRRSIVFIIVSVAVLALKLWLAWSTPGAADITVWESFAANIRECGVCVYHTGGLMVFPGGSRINPFNHPPGIIHFVKFITFVSDTFSVPFRAVFRSVTSVADLGSVLLTYHLLRHMRSVPSWGIWPYLLAPATIIISGYHGNTDTIMIGFVLLTALLIQVHSKWAGLAFGAALSIKIVPIIFAGAFLFHLADSRSRWRFVGFAAATGAVLSLPYILIEPVTIVRQVAGYSGFAGRWGFSRVGFHVLGPSDAFHVFVRAATYLLLAYIFWLSFKHRRKDLMVQLGLISFLFLAFTPAWGSNYLAWLDPFPIFLGIWPSLLYYISSGALLIYLYFINDDESTRLMGVCWFAVLFVTLIYLRRLRTNDART